MLKITFPYPDHESLGIEYLMAVCLEDGHEIDFVYYQAEDTYLGRKIKNISFRRIAERIAETRPHVVAFSCVTDNYRYQLDLAGALKEIMPDVVTVFGGIHPSAVPEKVLRNPEVDCIAIGEAEKSFSAFLRAGERDGGFALPDAPIEGMVFKKDGGLVGEIAEGPFADLNELPLSHKAPLFLAFKDLSHEYRIITSRGCPYRCSYCFNSSLYKLRGRGFFRQRSVDNVIGELVWAKTNYSLKYILFLDDSFTTNKQWVFEFCDRYPKEVGLPFSCYSNPTHISREIAEALRSAGCINMQIGVQSLSEELCSEVLHRKTDRAMIARTIDDLREIGIMVQVDHMLGIPGDTLELQEESLLFYNRHRPSLISIFWLTYYPGTDIVEIAERQGILTTDDIDRMEEGKRLTENSYLTGGSMGDPRPYYGISLMFNFLPILPGWLIRFLVSSRIYRILRIKNYFISTALPRVIQSIFNRKDFRGRSHIIRFVDKTLLQKLKRD